VQFGSFYIPYSVQSDTVQFSSCLLLCAFFKGGFLDLNWLVKLVLTDRFA